VDSGAKKLFLGFWGFVLVYVLFMGSLSLKYAKNDFQSQGQINLPEEFKELFAPLENQVKAPLIDEMHMPLQTNPFTNKIIVAKKQETFSSFHASQPPQPPPPPPQVPPPPPPIPNQVPPSFPPMGGRPQVAHNGTVFYPPFWNATLQNSTLQSQNATSLKKGLVLTSIIQTEENKVCVIDNKVYREGDVVKRYKIFKIGEDYVELQGSKGRLKVKVGDILDI
jgi:hypothetical protein